jgi:hypothetical protein
MSRLAGMNATIAEDCFDGLHNHEDIHGVVEPIKLREE